MANKSLIIRYVQRACGIWARTRGFFRHVNDYQHWNSPKCVRKRLAKSELDLRGGKRHRV